MNENVRMAIFTYGQITFPKRELATFVSAMAAQNPRGIANVVPTNIKAIFLNVEFKFNKQIHSY